MSFFTSTINIGANILLWLSPSAIMLVFQDQGSTWHWGRA